MNSGGSQIEQLESNLQRLKVRMPDLPICGVLLSRLLLHLGRGMSSMLELEIRPCGLAEAEFRVLSTLYSQPERMAHPSDLCACTAQSPANMSRISDALVERDLITRVASQHDRRRMVLRITPRGEALVQQLLPKLYESLRVIFAEFSDEDQSHLVTQLKRLGVSLDRVMSGHGAEREG